MEYIFLYIKWWQISQYLITALIVLVVIMVFQTFTRMAKTSAFKVKMQSFYRYLIGYTELEKKYIDYVFKIEEGKRSKLEIRDSFRDLVKNDPDLRFPEFASDKILKDFRKSINNR